MAICMLLILSFFSLFLISSCHIAGTRFQNVEDREHMKQHMQDGQDAGQLREEELLFHYFNSHDIDKNKKLDGLEILQAFIHHPLPEFADHSNDVIYSDQEFLMAIDPLLSVVIDKNQDGFLDYGEFIAAARFLRETHA